MAVNPPPQDFGYWTATILPLPRVERRFHPNQLVDLLGEAAVALRGWNFPHIPREAGGLDYQGDRVQGHTAWGQYQETWDFFTDGLFLQRWRMREDGTEYRGTIHLVATIYTITEVWELSRRLYGQNDTVEQVRVGIDLDNVGGRLGTWSTADDLPAGIHARHNRFQYKRTVPRVELFANPRDYAIETTSQLFRELGFPISDSYVRRRTEDFLAGRI